MGEYSYRDGQRNLSWTEMEVLKEAGWELALEHFIEDDDTPASRRVYAKFRAESESPFLKVACYWDDDSVESELVVNSLGYTPDFGLLLDDMVSLGLKG